MNLSNFTLDMEVLDIDSSALIFGGEPPVGFFERVGYYAHAAWDYLTTPSSNPSSMTDSASGGVTAPTSCHY